MFHGVITVAWSDSRKKREKEHVWQCRPVNPPYQSAARPTPPALESIQPHNPCTTVSWTHHVLSARPPTPLAIAHGEGSGQMLRLSVQAK
eukprot:1139808-Pelagomonas_calceolata.AAC.3